RVLRLDVHDELVEVGALLDTGGLDLVGHLEDRRVDRVDRNAADLRVEALVLGCGDVAAAPLDRELDLELALGVDRREVQVGVVDLDTRRRGDVTGGDDARALLAQVHRSEEHTSELQSRENLVCRLLLEKKKTERTGVVEDPK